MIKVEGVSYWYPGSPKPAIEGLSFSVGEGEFVLITGPSGCGKSTLCRMLNGLVPKYSGGRFSGRVVVDGLDTRTAGIADLSRHVGLVFQDPESQFVMADVENEMAFGLENLCLEAGEIRRRVGEVAERLGIQSLLGRKTSELSGGEKQKVVLASVLAFEPGVLVLDEPTSQLDPQSRREFLRTVSELNRKQGITVVMVEHNVDEVVDSVGRAFDLGRRKFITPGALKSEPRYESRRAGKPRSNRPCITVDGLSKWYGGRRVLFDVSLEVVEGEFVALTGRNGSGKTTLVKHFNGLLKPQKGRVLVCGMDASKTPAEELARAVGYLPQNPSDSFFRETVEDEVAQTLRNFGYSVDAAKVLEKFGLAGHGGAYPRDLSVGQKQRLALASATAYDPRVLVLDEPTRGIDQMSRRTLVGLLHKLHGEGTTIILITQDERLAETAGRRIALDGGRVRHG